MEHHRFSELVKKMASGNILPEEAAQLREVMDHLSPEELYRLFPEREWEVTAEIPARSEEIAQSRLAYEAVWKQLKKEPIIMPVRRNWWHNGWIRAACFTGILVGAIGLYFQFNPSTQGLSVNQTIAWKEISTLPGEQRELMLPDGSKIYMNGRSTVQYPASFEGNSRQITLVSGEMFLEVQHNETKPFIVQTENLRVKVLGTSFSICNWPGEKEVSVAVKTGKVAFSAGDTKSADHLLLTPGKKGYYKKQTGVMEESTCSITSIGGWITGEFIFEDATLEEILTSFENSYGFRYRIDNIALRNKHFKAGFRGQTPQQMVRILSKMGDFNYTVKDSTFIIH